MAASSACWVDVGTLCSHRGKSPSCCCTAAQQNESTYTACLMETLMGGKQLICVPRSDTSEGWVKTDGHFWWLSKETGTPPQPSAPSLRLHSWLNWLNWVVHCFQQPCCGGRTMLASIWHWLAFMGDPNTWQMVITEHHSIFKYGLLIFFYFLTEQKRTNYEKKTYQI